MRSRFQGVLMTLALVAMAMALPAAEAEPSRAFVGAQILTIEGPAIADGVLLVSDGQIAQVGTRDEVEIPVEAEVVDVSGKVIMPGLVDTHSHIGGGGAADGSAPIQPEARIYDSFNVRSSGLDRARAGGLTTINVMPGSGHLMSGQTIYLKLRDGNTIDDLTIVAEDGWIAGGMKMANGTNSRRDPPFPGTRGKSAALVRAHYLKALEYQKKVEAAAGNPDEMPERDLAMEAMLEVLSGRRVVHHHTHRHDDILTVLRLQKEFGFRVVLQHVSEGWKVADEIAAAGVPASVIVIDSPGGKLEARDLILETGRVLDEAGVNVGFHTDDWITDSRLFLRSGALAVRAGMDRDRALRAMTLAGAEMLDLDDRIGTLSEGKDADFIVLSGDPFSVYTKVEQTWIEGAKVFDLEDPEDRLMAVGGYGAGNPRHAHISCFDLEEGR